MKTVVIGFLLLGLVAGGVLYVQKIRQAKEEQAARAAEADHRLAELEENARRDEQKHKGLESQLLEARSEAAAKTAETHELKQQLAGTSKPTRGPELNPGAKLLKDPQMKATMKK